MNVYKLFFIIVVVAVVLLLLSACSAFEGQVSEKVKTFTDDHGRVCTIVKWGDTASVDCDWSR